MESKYNWIHCIHSWNSQRIHYFFKKYCFFFKRTFTGMPRGAQVTLNSMKLTISINHLLALLVPFLCRNFYFVIILFVNSCFNPELLTFYSGNPPGHLCWDIFLMFLWTFKVLDLKFKIKLIWNRICTKGGTRVLILSCTCR